MAYTSAPSVCLPLFLSSTLFLLRRSRMALRLLSSLSLTISTYDGQHISTSQRDEGATLLFCLRHQDRIGDYGCTLEASKGISAVAPLVFSRVRP